jgi:hypothetical protein
MRDTHIYAVMNSQTCDSKKNSNVTSSVLDLEALPRVLKLHYDLSTICLYCGKY